MVRPIVRAGSVFVFVVGLSLALTPAVVAAGDRYAGGPKTPPAPSIAWTGCPVDPFVDLEFVDPAAQCGSLTVPLD